MRARLYINHIPSLDLPIALEYGRVADGQPANNWVAVGERLRYLFDWEAGRCLGFRIHEFSAFDPWHGDTHIDEIWDGPRFDAPSLTQECLSVGYLVGEVRGRLGGRPSFGRVLLEAATAAEGEEAVELWQQCLEAGDSTAHLGLGRTLYGLRRYPDAYHHLWYYAKLAPCSASAAYWHGRVAAAMGLGDEAKTALEHAVEPGAAHGEETNAAQLLNCWIKNGAMTSPR